MSVAGASMKNKLKKWREEKEKKKRQEALDRAKSKPSFVFKARIERKDTELFKKDMTASDKKKASSFQHPASSSVVMIQ